MTTEDRERAAQWAKATLDKAPLILDTETTGLGYGVEPVQIAVIDSQGNALLDTLLRPVRAMIQPDAFAVHGIDLQAVKDAPALSDIHDQLLDILNGREVVVYNAKYDAGVIGYACHACEVENISAAVQWVDLMAPYAAFYGELKPNGMYRWQKLTAACYQQDIEVTDAHSALGDCLMSLALMNKMAKFLDGK